MINDNIVSYMKHKRNLEIVLDYISKLWNQINYNPSNSQQCQQNTQNVSTETIEEMKDLLNEIEKKKGELQQTEEKVNQVIKQGNVDQIMNKIEQHEQNLDLLTIKEKFN